MITESRNFSLLEKNENKFPANWQGKNDITSRSRRFGDSSKNSKAAFIMHHLSARLLEELCDADNLAAPNLSNYFNIIFEPVPICILQEKLWLLPFSIL